MNQTLMKNQKKHHRNSKRKNRKQNLQVKTKIQMMLNWQKCLVVPRITRKQLLLRVILKRMKNLKENKWHKRKVLLPLRLKSQIKRNLQVRKKKLQYQFNVIKLKFFNKKKLIELDQRRLRRRENQMLYVKLKRLNNKRLKNKNKRNYSMK